MDDPVIEDTVEPLTRRELEALWWAEQVEYAADLEELKEVVARFFREHNFI